MPRQNCWQLNMRRAVFASMPSLPVSSRRRCMRRKHMRHWAPCIRSGEWVRYQISSKRFSIWKPPISSPAKVSMWMVARAQSTEQPSAYTIPLGLADIAVFACCRPFENDLCQRIQGVADGGYDKSFRAEPSGRGSHDEGHIENHGADFRQAAGD